MSISFTAVRIKPGLARLGEELASAFMSSRAS
jgi:hypothetical protein